MYTYKIKVPFTNLVWNKFVEDENTKIKIQNATRENDNIHIKRHLTVTIPIPTILKYTLNLPNTHTFEDNVDINFKNESFKSVSEGESFGFKVREETIVEKDTMTVSIKIDSNHGLWVNNFVNSYYIQNRLPIVASIGEIPNGKTEKDNLNYFSV